MSSDAHDTSSEVAALFSSNERSDLLCQLNPKVHNIKALYTT